METKQMIQYILRWAEYLLYMADIKFTEWLDKRYPHGYQGDS